MSILRYIHYMVFTIGNYLPGNSVLHRFDPRFKILSILSFSIAALIIESQIAYLIMLFVLITGAVAAGIKLRLFIVQLRIWGWLLVITMLLHLLFTKGEPFLSFLSIELTYEGLYRGILFGTRFLVFILSAFILTITTSPFELTRGFVSLIKPLRWIKIPVDDLGMVIGIAFRFIPVIFNEAVSVKTAQEGRGVDFSRGNMLKPNRLIPLLVPMFYLTFKKADDLTEALISRNYTPGIKRTSLYGQEVTSTDILILTAVIILCVSIVVLF
ncbi:MAG: energy-coupling factor transporter transmembrane protein EcfT [candidate division Zixibacteria bacterium]|nr:energy-coupling factor transporter transmembrane protein EcfT [candidate division Zixibacteria bacterium]